MKKNRIVVLRVFRLAGVFVWAMALSLQGVALAQGVAMVLDRAGSVETVSAGKISRLNVLDYLAADAELRVAAGASATLVYLGNSREWQFTGAGRYRLQADQPVVLQGSAPKVRGVPVPAAQAMVRLEPAQRERLALGAMVMRGDGPLRIVSPNGVDVLDARPTLLWLAGEGQPVRVSILDEAQRSLAETVTSAAQWSMPRELDPGDYTWRIEVASSGGGSPRLGRFRVIGANDERREMLRAAPGEFAQRVAHAIMLESQDLPHDALLLWRALAAERPDEESLKQWAR